MLLMYMSAIFYTVDGYPAAIQRLFPVCNPVYCVIKYVRLVVLEAKIPSAAFHLLLLFYAALAMLVGEADLQKEKTTSSSITCKGKKNADHFTGRGRVIRYITGDFKDIGHEEYVLRKLTGNYQVKKFWADWDVTFELEKGDMLGIVGTNGAGKVYLAESHFRHYEFAHQRKIQTNGTVAALLERPAVLTAT